MTDAVYDGEDAPRGGFGQPALLPEAGAAGAPLTAVVAVMGFLATLALAGALIVAGAAAQWTADLTGALTVQVTNGDPDEISRQTEAALRILNETPGVAKAEARDRAATAALLEPWLGSNLPDTLPVPSLIEVDLAPDAAADMALLRTRLSAAAPDASVDDHKVWNNKLLKFSTALQWTAAAVVVLVFAAMAATVVFAARAGLAANHEIVDVLHLIGAEDQFIAAQVQRHFFFLGLKGAFIGLAGAAAILYALSSGGQGGYFLPAGALTPQTWATLLIAPAAACLLTTLTARATVLKALSSRL
ncbi:MAG: cell division protein [Pseudomonadota bacterium]